MATSASDLFAGDATSDSDSDGAVEYYHPISTTADDSEHDVSEAPAHASAPNNGFSIPQSNGTCGGGASNQCPRNPNRITSVNGGFGINSVLPNGITSVNGIDINSVLQRTTENGVSGLHLSDDEEEKEQEREAEIRRAFREDERRRTAPLTPENASRVMEAMRGVAFLGVPPDWTARVGEENWVRQLRRIRGGGGGSGHGGDP